MREQESNQHAPNTNSEQTPRSSTGVRKFLLYLFRHLKLAVIYGPFGLLVWACVCYGQKGDNRQSQCTTRLHNEGFDGNSDFYGLGIRLGLYLQWISSILANAYLKSERRIMAGAYAASTLAMLIALLLLIFRHKCVFTAEVIIMLYFLWGGWYQVMLPYMLRWNALYKSESRPEDTRLRGLNIYLVFLNYSVAAVTAWFWVRLGSAGEVDFARTPRGTSFFFVDQITGADSVRVISIILAAITIWNSSSPLVPVFYSPLKWLGFSDRVYHVLILLSPVGFLTIISTTYHILYILVIDRVGLLFALCFGRPTKDRQTIWKKATRGVGTEESVLDNANVFLGCCIFAYTVLAIELTLYWNKVDNINNIESTGQIVPLIIGLALLLSTIWKMLEKDDSFNWPTAFQQSDSTWNNRYIDPCMNEDWPRPGKLGYRVLAQRYHHPKNIFWWVCAGTYECISETKQYLIDMTYIV